MREKRKKYCMFCGEDESFGRMNKEHFVPKALWNGSRPALTRTVDAHVECNDSFAGWPGQSGRVA